MRAFAYGTLASLLLVAGCASSSRQPITDLNALNGTWRGQGSSAETVEWVISGERYEATVIDKERGTLKTSGTLRREGDQVAFKSENSTGTVTLRDAGGERKLKIKGKNHQTGREFSADLARAR